jgi:hypothetical protein
MKLFSNISNFLTFRYSFILKTELEFNYVLELLKSRIKKDPSFLDPVFKNNHFAFSHKNFAPGFYNFSPILFLVEIRNQSTVSVLVTVKIVPLFFWFYLLGIISIVACYTLNIGGVKDQFVSASFPLHPYYSPLLIVFPYFYYWFKIRDVKGTLKIFLKSK